MNGTVLAAIIGGLALVLLVGIALVVRAGSVKKIIATPAAAAAAAIPKPSEIAPPATLRTTIAIAMRELRVLVAGGRGPTEIPWALAIGTGGADLAALLPPPLEPEHELSWLDDKNLGKVGTVTFRTGGVVLGFEDGLVGEPQAERRLIDLLREVEVVRPHRPIDSLVIVMPWSFLVEAGEEGIAARGRSLYELILTVQQRTGWRVPVYLLIAGAEDIPGFAALASAVLARADNPVIGPVIGWPAPKALDTLFDPTWIDDAFDTLAKTLTVEQLHVLMGMEGNAAAEDVLLLPARIAAIKPALRLLLGQMLESSVYHEGFMLRGIFLTGDTTLDAPAAGPLPIVGDAAEPTEGEVPPPAAQPLAQNLFCNKIFPESDLAQPAYGERTRRHRLVRRLQRGVVVALLLFGVSMAVIPYLASNRVPPVEALLNAIIGIEIQSDRNRAVMRDLTGNCVDRAAVDGAGMLGAKGFERNRRQSIAMLERMSAFDLNHVETLFAPTSIFSGVNHRIETAIKNSFHDVVFNAISDSMTTPVGIEALVAANTPPDEFEGYWRATVQNVSLYDRNYALLRQMQDKSAHEVGLLKEFADIVRYSLGEELPPEFKRNYRVYSAGIAEYPVPCLYSRVVRDTINRTLAARYQRAVELIYLRNPVVLAANAITRRFDGSEEEDRSDESLNALAKELEIVSEELAVPRKYAWIFAPTPADLPMPRITDLQRLTTPDGLVVARLPDANRLIAVAAMARLRDARLFGMALLEEDRGAEAKAILAKAVPPGSMLASAASLSTDAGLPRLSPGAIDARNFLRALFSQSFMVDRDPPVTYFTGKRTGWDSHKLQVAQAAVKNFAQFRATGSGAMPSRLHSIALATAQRHFAEHVEQLIDESAQPLSAVVNLSPPPAQAEAQNFAQALALLTSIRDQLRDIGAEDVAVRLDTRVAEQAGQLLADADRALAANGGPYAVNRASLAAWDGTGSLAAAAFGVDTLDDLKDIIPERRARVIAIAQTFAAPVLTYFDGATNASSATTIALAARWQAIRQTLDANAANSPNSLARLEQYILVDLDRLQGGDCAKIRIGSARSGDYFAQAQAAITTRVFSRCRAVAADTTVRQYARLRQTFNDTLANRFPFSTFASSPGADPAAVQAFFQQYGALLEPLKAAIAQDPGFGGSGAAAATMLDRLVRVQTVLAPMLEPGQARLGYRVGVEFFPKLAPAVGQSQVIDATIGVLDSTADDDTAGSNFQWYNGDPVSVALRWAANAPTIPALADGTCPQQPGERRFVASEEGDWALLRLLRKQGPAPRDGAVSPEVPIAFEMKLCENPDRASGGDPVRARARIFLQLSLSLTIKQPDKPERQVPVILPPFPDSAPALTRTDYRR